MVLPINTGGSLCPPNVFWRVGSSAVLFTNTTFVGNILALTTITLQTGTSLRGRALARNGAVNLDTNTISICAPAIACPIITVNPASLPNGNVGTPYNQSVVASGGTAPYTYSVSGPLPAGLTLNPGTGAITGIPTTAAASDFTITATDNLGCQGSRLYRIVIAAAGCPVITLSPNVLPAGTGGAPYSTTITASGGAPGSYTFGITGGALPGGLSLNTGTGAITGIPNAPGFFSFTVRAIDSGGTCSGSAPYSIVIALAVLPASGPTLSWGGMAVLIVLLSVAAMFVMSKLSL